MRPAGSTLAGPVVALPGRLLDWRELAEARAALAAGTPRLVLEGLWGSARALALAGLLPADRPACLIAADGPAAGRLVDDLRAFSGTLGLKPAEAVAALPVPGAALWRGAADREDDAERVGLLGRLVRGEPVWVVTTPRGLTAEIPAPVAFRRGILTVAVGDSLDRDALLDHLQATGYERVETVSAVGQWSVRGGIVDIFSPTGRDPVRLELAGDEVDALRRFDPTTQRSTEAVGQLAILPLGGL
ncbi:MAG TPA: hypothetical protein VLD61_08955, partial [Methylomirabilota bacterium]|nr:hypothetical protein [Methylomirabilota bacterium]